MAESASRDLEFHPTLAEFSLGRSPNDNSFDYRSGMKVLVTGGAGYIGSVTATALEQAGHTPVVLDSFQGRLAYDSSARGLKIYDDGEQPLLEVEEITTDLSVLKVLRGARLPAPLRTHDASHGAGQIRPVNSGKLFVACSMRIASCHRSL